tara:strand:+ start:916 stop:1188 length:273 start_codon:yes stop_codon:yes gene_type:complete
MSSERMKEGFQCRYLGCKTRILNSAHIGDYNTMPTWVKEQIRNGYCMKHGILEFSDMIPIVNPDPEAEYDKWALIDGELTPLIFKGEEEE